VVEKDAGNLSLPYVTKGPACARPMALQLPGEDEIIGNGDGVVTQELPSGKQLEQSESCDVDACLVH
jgi:hypothetical protein